MPLLVNTVGVDAMQEKIVYIFHMAALELGYAVLTFEGPGQGILLAGRTCPSGRTDFRLAQRADARRDHHDVHRRRVRAGRAVGQVRRAAEVVRRADAVGVGPEVLNARRQRRGRHVPPAGTVHLCRHRRQRVPAQGQVPGVRDGCTFLAVLLARGQRHDGRRGAGRCAAGQEGGVGPTARAGCSPT
ncbi:hypothetical protein B0T22DRAFT_300076 [Podospora appendiculata]|uniref:Uncharacterized protein n=1 Tax=Podospora appendiculata TaxID=314037 RepID=A0AAE0WZY0_9PEZI|nr:hypothetical protein B0T22DRAFT_300076 [Podospora appendiculata]